MYVSWFSCIYSMLITLVFFHLPQKKFLNRYIDGSISIQTQSPGLFGWMEQKNANNIMVIDINSWILDPCDSPDPDRVPNPSMKGSPSVLGRAEEAYSFLHAL